MENVHSYPEKVALEFIDPPYQRVTYRELDELVLRAMAYLHNLGVQPGDRVAVNIAGVPATMFRPRAPGRRRSQNPSGASGGS